MSEYIKNLNPAQSAAVVNFEGASLIVAGAGSGKTRVLTCRIAYMLEKGVAPHTILSLTFTNKAAAEMRERIGALVGASSSRHIWMGTFHSIFARILRAEADKLGYPSSFTIYDTSDAKNVIKSIIKEKSLNDENYKPNEILSRISLCKNNLVTPQSYEANTTLVTEDREKRRPEFGEVYKMYARKCREYGAMDFDDLLLNINILFRDFPEVLAKYQQMFRYILVDEYQDTNYAQYIIIRRLAEHHANVCVVGDDAQSIYSFRGAKIENILRFKKDFPKAQIFKLEQNYRSTRTIVDAANSVIAKNLKQIKKESFSEGEQGENIKVIKAYTDQEEGSLVAEDLRTKVRESGAEWSEVAILYRTNAQSRVLEESLRRRSIPYKIYGGTSFYQRKEIKDLIAYIRLVVNPRDDEAFKRIINYPTRGIGDVTVSKIAAAATSHNVSLWEAVSTLDMNDIDLRGGAGKKVLDFVELIRSMSLLREQMGLYELGLEIATRSGILGLYKLEQTPEATSALDNIQELLNSMQVFKEMREQELEQMMSEGSQGAQDEDGQIPNAEAQPLPSGEPTIEEWLQNIALLTDVDNEKPEEKNKVTLMTVHSAKGLEFRYVFIVGMEENLFPNLMGLGSQEGLEEERRLFYVALTRAKEAAVMSFSETRFKWGSMEFCKPSRFLSEIDSRYLDLQFDLEDTRMEDDKPKKTYGGASNSSPAARGNYRGSGVGNGGGYNGGSYANGGAGESGRPERGDAAQRWKPASAATSPQRGATGRTSPAIAEIARTDVGEGTRFKSVGARPVSCSESAAASVDQPYEVGLKVEHAKFGVGTIAEIEQITGDIKLIIDFAREGRKTLLSKYAKLNILNCN